VAEKIQGMRHKICRNCFIIKKQEREDGDWLTCVNCNKSFLFSISDQKFYRSKDFSPPKRCFECRKARISRPSSVEVNWIDEIYNGFKNIWGLFKN
jgi:hypothetical protein